MVSFAEDALTGLIEKFIAESAEQLSVQLTRETELWLHRSLCYHVPDVFTSRLPLTPAERDFIMDRCQVTIAPLPDTDDHWTATVLVVDGVPRAELRARVTEYALTVRYDCRGLLP